MTVLGFDTSMPATTACVIPAGGDPVCSPVPDAARLTAKAGMLEGRQDLPLITTFCLHLVNGQAAEMVEPLAEAHVDDLADAFVQYARTRADYLQAVFAYVYGLEQLAHAAGQDLPEVQRLAPPKP